MNGAENYIEHIRNGALRRTAAAFMLYTLLASVCCGLAWQVFRQWSTDVSWQIASPPGAPFISAVLTQGSTILFLLIRWAGVFTAFSRTISVLTAAVQGCAIGCCAALLSRGLVSGVTPEWLWADFASLLILLILCALSDLYADCLLTLTGIRERRIRFSLIREYTLILAVFAGILILIGIPASMFLT